MEFSGQHADYGGDVAVRGANSLRTQARKEVVTIFRFCGARKGAIRDDAVSNDALGQPRYSLIDRGTRDHVLVGRAWTSCVNLSIALAAWEPTSSSRSHQ